MTIQLTPEDQALIEKRLQSGAFQSVEEVIHDALASHQADSNWLLANRSQIERHIATGLEQLGRGEGIPGDEARMRLKQCNIMKQ